MRIFAVHCQAACYRLRGEQPRKVNAIQAVVFLAAVDFNVPRANYGVAVVPYKVRLVKGKGQRARGGEPSRAASGSSETAAGVRVQHKGHVP